MTAKASIPAGDLAQNLLATIDASADPSRPPIHPDTLALYDLFGDGRRLGEALIKLFSLKWGTNLGREVVNKPLTYQ